MDPYQELWNLISGISYHLVGAFKCVTDYLLSNRLDQQLIDHRLNHLTILTVNDGCYFCKYELEVVIPRHLQSQPPGCDEVD